MAWIAAKPVAATLKISRSGKLVSQKKLPGRVDLEPGEYTVEISHPGYETPRVSLKIATGEIVTPAEKQATLRRFAGRLLITGAPHKPGLFTFYC